MSDLKDLLSEAAELETADFPETASGTRKNQEAAKVYSVRLAPSMVEDLECLGKDLDIPTSALIRGFIADGLEARRGESVLSLTKRMEHDIRRLRGLLT